MAFPEICPILTPQIPNQHNKPLHSLRHAGAHHSGAAPPARTRYQRHAGRCTAQHSRPIIIMYIRGRPCYGSMPDSAADRRPCQPGGVSILPTPGGLQSGTGQQSGRTGWSPTPSRTVQQQGAAGGAEPLTATAVSFFGLSPDS